MSTITDKTVKTSKLTIKFHVERYNTVSEMVEDCKIRPITDRNFDDVRTKAYSDKFEGVKNYDEALELLAGGYQPIVESMRGVFKATKKGAGKRFKTENSIQGFAPIIPLALKGVPNNMLNMTIRPIKAKVLDIYYDMTCAWNIDSKDVIKAGEKLLSTVIELEKQGYRFNIYGCQTYSDPKSADVLAVKIKDSAQPLDLKRVSFQLAHVAFFRVIGFDWYSRVPGGTYRMGYGRALHYTAKNEDKSGKLESEIVKGLFGDNATYFSAATVIEKMKDKEQNNYIEEVLTNAKCKD